MATLVPAHNQSVSIAITRINLYAPADMTILMPVVNGVSGDLAGIAVSKLSTELHADRRHRVNTSKHETAATKGHPLQTAQAVGSVISVLSVADEAYHQSCFGELENPVATFCTFSCARSNHYAYFSIIYEYCTAPILPT